MIRSATRPHRYQETMMSKWMANGRLFLPFIKVVMDTIRASFILCRHHKGIHIFWSTTLEVSQRCKRHPGIKFIELFMQTGLNLNVKHSVTTRIREHRCCWLFQLEESAVAEHILLFKETNDLVLFITFYIVAALRADWDTGLTLTGNKITCDCD